MQAIIYYVIISYRAVQKLYSMRDSKTIRNDKNKREVTLNQLPFFFLASGKELKRLEIINNGGVLLYFSVCNLI